MEQELLDDALELDALATPGPWFAHYTDDMYAANAVFVSTQPKDEQIDPGRGLAAGAIEQIEPGYVVAIVLLQNPPLANISDERWDCNARFIAAARTYMPQMAKEIISLRGQINAMRQGK